MKIRSQKGIKFDHLNTRSLLRHRDELELDLFEGSFDVIILTETWLNAAIVNSLVDFPNYKLVRLDRQVTGPLRNYKTGGGICIYVRDSFDVTTCQDGCVSNSNIELVHVKISKMTTTRVLH